MVTINIFRSERFRRLYKEGFWVVIGQAMAVLGALVGMRLLTEFLTPASYGELALGMTAATLINQTVLGPLSNGVSRYYAPAVELNDIGNYLHAVRELVFWATGIILFIILLVICTLLMTGYREWIAIAFASLIFAVLSGYNSILNNIQNAARQRIVVALHQGMEPWVKFVAAVGVMTLLGSTSTLAMVGYVVAIGFVLVSQYIFFCRSISKDVRRESRKRRWDQDIWRYSFPFASWGVFIWIQQASDRWALGMFGTTHDVGLYAVLYQIGIYPIAMVTGLAMQFLAPILYQRYGDASDSGRIVNANGLNLRLTWLVLGLTSAAALVAFVFNAQIFHAFVAKEYASISFLLPWMVLAGGVFAAAQVMALNLMGKMIPHIMMKAKITTALLGTLLNFFGAYWYGTIGVVIANMVFSVSSFIWLAKLCNKRDRLLHIIGNDI